MTHYLSSIVALCLLVWSALCVGCSAATPREGRAYPSGSALETLDIQVERFETVLTMTNTSARAFGPSVLWANASYAREIDGFGVGESLRLDLGHFVDEYGNRFRAGGFFATRQPEDLVLMEIEEGSTGDRYGLIVVGGEGR